MKSGECKICPTGHFHKIAVVAHLFYLEQAEAIVEFLKHIPLEFDIYASSSPENSERVQALLVKAFPGREIVLKRVRNRGFDISPFVCDFGSFYASYDLVLKLHTKRSPHVLWLNGWGDYLLKNMIGSPSIVEGIQNMFIENNRLGIVYPEIIPSLKEELAKDAWQENWPTCSDLSSRLGLSIEKEMLPDFPAGSMFWFRPKALESLFQLGLTEEDFPDEKRIRRNGTLAHAVERLLILIAAKEGFSSRSVCFEAFPITRNKSFLGKVCDKIYCEWSRLLDFMGIHH